MNVLQRIGSTLGGAVGAMAAGWRKSFASEAARWLRGDDVGEGEPSARFTRPYAQSAWVSAAVNLVASEISGRPLKFYAGESEYEDARLAEFWAAPALGPRVQYGVQPRLSREQVLFDLAAWERLEGEFFIVLDESWLLLSARRTAAALPPFLIAHPQRMQAVVHGGELAAWRYTDAGGRQFTFLPEQVIYHRSFNPYDDWRGLGRLQAARIAAEGAFLTGAYIRNLARNNGDQGFIVVGKSGPATPEQKEQIVADLRAKRAALSRGEARDLFISGGDIAVDRPKEQAASAELTASKGLSHQEIFVAFEVPPSMSAVKASYSIGKDSDRYQLITGPCQSVGAKIASALAVVASKQAGQMLSGELEWDDHPVMVEVRHSRLESALKLWTVGMPMQAANDYLDLGMQAFPGWDVGYLPFSVAPVEGGEGTRQPGTGDPATDPELSEPAEEDPQVAQLKLLVLARQRSQQRTCARVEAEREVARDPFAVFACTCHGAESVEMKARDPKELAQWRTIKSRQRAALQEYQSRITKELMLARAEVLRRIAEKYTPAKGVATKAGAADFLFDLAKFSQGLVVAMRKQSALSLQKAGEDLYKEIGRDDPFKYPAEEVLEFTRTRENRITDAAAAIHASIKETLEEGYVGGDTQEELTRRVQGAFNGISKGRARTIAATETGIVYNAGRAKAMEEAGVQWKKWLTSGNDNVRAAHASANGQTVRAELPFEIAGEQMMFPGDDSLGASAENIINCHCVQIAVSEGPKD